jgi:hypothetical protein
MLRGALINAPLQRGGGGWAEDLNRFSGLSGAGRSVAVVKTAKAVGSPSVNLATPLKRGVNESSARKASEPSRFGKLDYSSNWPDFAAHLTHSTHLTHPTYLTHSTRCFVRFLR